MPESAANTASSVCALPSAFPLCAITSTHCIKMRESVVFFVTRAAKSMTDMFKGGAATLDASVELSRPSFSVFKVVKALVITMDQYSQILRSVIQRVVVDVMHVLVPFELTAKYLFQHQAMLKFPEAWVRDFYLHVSEAVLAGPRAPRAYWALNASGHGFDYIDGGKK